MKAVVGFVCGVVAGFSLGISEKVTVEKKKPIYRGYFNRQNDQKGEH
mgnify:CR=1 FL=1